jgi:membrane protein YqaA with SNARE-associated domain
MQAFSEFSDAITASPEFQAFGVVILFLWTIIPSVKSIVPEVFSFPLLTSGISPIILITVSALGATVGDYVLYLLGRGTHRLFKGKKELARADHLLHKYRLPIFVGTPFLGTIGDIIVYVAGFERVGFIRILPFILAGQFLRMSLGIFALMGLIQLPDFFGT